MGDAMALNLENVGSRYGAPMGRSDAHPGGAACAIGRGVIHSIPIDDGGYDEGGAYWGIGTPLWCAVVHDLNGSELRLFFRSVIPMHDAAPREFFPEIEEWGMG